MRGEVRVLDETRNMRTGLQAVLPGLALCALLGVAARWAEATLVPPGAVAINYVLIAILLGLLLRNALPLPDWLAPGIRFAASFCLYLGVVLLGAGLDLMQIFTVGSSALLMVAFSIAGSIVICGAMARRIGAGSRWGHLVGAGIGVCGVSAIMALAPAIRARQREIVTAIGAALLTDMLVLLTLPFTAHLLGWGDTLVGFLSGVIPSNTAQAVAIGHAYSLEAGTVATIVKSARNALLPVVVVTVTYLYTVRGLPVGERAGLGLFWARFPKFILGFLAAAALSSAGAIPPQLLPPIKEATTWLFVTCFCAIGLGIKLSDLGRQDLTVMGFGLVMTVLLAAYAYAYSVLLLV